MIWFATCFYVVFLSKKRCRKRKWQEPAEPARLRDADATEPKHESADGSEKLGVEKGNDGRLLESSDRTIVPYRVILVVASGKRAGS